MLIPLLLGGGFSGPQYKAVPETIHIALVSMSDEVSSRGFKKEAKVVKVDKVRPETGKKPEKRKHGISRDKTDTVRIPSVQESVAPSQIPAEEVAGFDSDGTESHGELPVAGSRLDLSSSNISTPGNTPGHSVGNSAGESAVDSTNHQPEMRTGPETLRLLRNAIEKAKKYPAIAKRRGLEGTVITEFSINSKGFPENIRIAKSSGFQILDSATKDTILRSAPLPHFNGLIEIPITFRLQK